MRPQDCMHLSSLNSAVTGPTNLVSHPGMPTLLSFLLPFMKKESGIGRRPGTGGKHTCVTKAQSPGRLAHTGSFDIISYSGWKCLASSEKGFALCEKVEVGDSSQFLFIHVHIFGQGGWWD